MSWTLVVVVLVSFGLALLRFNIEPRRVSPAGTYQAVAHLFVGGLIGATCAGGAWHWLWIALALSAVEVFAAWWTRRE